MGSLVKKIAQYEKEFAKRNYNGGGKQNFIIRPGKIPIMISAPHAINHFREEGEKRAEKYTGGIARYLQKATQCHLIYSARYAKTDPNYGEEGEYKLALASEKHAYMLYNKYTNTKYWLKLKKYGGKRDNKVFMPYYYRQLLMAEYPLPEIQETYYKQLLRDLTEKRDRKCMESCYELKVWEKVYVLKDGLQKEQIARLRELEEKKLGDNPLELLSIPQSEKVKSRFWKRIIGRIKEFVLKLYIGYAAYELRVCRPMAMDDQNDTARLSLNMMQILGVSPNDKLLVRFGDKQVNLRVLEAQTEASSDMLIGLPARARKELGISGINDIVEVRRNMSHIFLRNMSQQVFAVLGSILAVTALSDNTVFRWVVGIALAPIAIYLVMSDVRIGTKRSSRDMGAI